VTCSRTAYRGPARSSGVDEARFALMRSAPAHPARACACDRAASADHCSTSDASVAARGMQAHCNKLTGSRCAAVAGRTASKCVTTQHASISGPLPASPQVSRMHAVFFKRFTKARGLSRKATACGQAHYSLDLTRPFPSKRLTCPQLIRRGASSVKWYGQKKHCLIKYKRNTYKCISTLWRTRPTP